MLYCWRLAIICFFLFTVLAYPNSHREFVDCRYSDDLLPVPKINYLDSLTYYSYNLIFQDNTTILGTTDIDHLVVYYPQDRKNIYAYFDCSNDLNPSIQNFTFFSYRLYHDYCMRLGRCPLTTRTPTVTLTPTSTNTSTVTETEISSITETLTNTKTPTWTITYTETPTGTITLTDTTTSTETVTLTPNEKQPIYHPPPFYYPISNNFPLKPSPYYYPPSWSKPNDNDSNNSNKALLYLLFLLLLIPIGVSICLTVSLLVFAVYRRRQRPFPRSHLRPQFLPEPPGSSVSL